ncbi:MAG TPA: undecaprenyldiphospho-muramoylpentapeptide beta-N-acetylglucosaminyltransferase [Lachnospiraceae bacterium]|nr:undecaprenyldiphospho-muramoylpentapeptide beta-N-acetylglucosaminyltransferase [Lachnospiraceae bacterium]
MADNRKIIVLTGGGTAGHVTPNLALLPYLKEAGYKVYYFGSKNGIEKKLIADYEIPYFGISTGKLRRYFDVKNFSDPFRVIHGYREARKILKNIKPDVVFSKGGFVSVPVVRAARSLHIPCIIHESDMTPGLANKLCFSSASKICCNFPETLSKLPKGKAVLSGTPIRDEIFTGDREKGLALCGFTPDLPVIMIMGGSQGALAVNEAVRAHLDELLQDFQIIHLCGAGKLDESLQDRKGYKQFEYVKEDLRHLFAATDLIISRSGANAICEILALKIPNILVPLAVGSRGDQVLNAESFVSQGFSVLVPTDELNARIVDTVHQVYKDRAKYKEAMEKSSQGSAIPVIMDLIKNAGKSR